MRHCSRNGNGLVLLRLYFFIHCEFDCGLDLALLCRRVISGWTACEEKLPSFILMQASLILSPKVRVKTQIKFRYLFNFKCDTLLSAN